MCSKRHLSLPKHAYERSAAQYQGVTAVLGAGLRQMLLLLAADGLGGLPAVATLASRKHSVHAR